MKKDKTDDFKISKDQKTLYYIAIETVDPKILFVVNKVFAFLKNNNTAGKKAIEDYMLKKLGRYSQQTGERRFKVYVDMLNSIENDKLKDLWIGVEEQYFADFWEVFFLIYSDFYILQNLAIQR